MSLDLAKQTFTVLVDVPNWGESDRPNRYTDHAAAMSNSRWATPLSRASSPGRLSRPLEPPPEAPPVWMLPLRKGAGSAVRQAMWFWMMTVDTADGEPNSNNG